MSTIVKLLDAVSTANDKQLLFFNADARHIAYGGARGGGKSYAMRIKFVMLAIKYDNLKILLLRRTLPELRENHVLPLQSLLYDYAQYKDSEKAFLFPNGSRIRLGYCDHESDVYQYQGTEWDVIGMEEATHFTESMRDFFITCNRSTRTDFKPRMYYTSNPGNIGHQWFKRLFVDREYKSKERPEDYVFVPAKVYDNTVLMENNPEYVEALENLPEDMKKAHLYGDWNVFAGQYFTEFRKDIHVIEPFNIPPEWKRYISLDYGLDMLACLWFAIDTKGNVFIYKELYEKDLIITEACRRIKEVNGDDNIVVRYAPPDLWNRRQDTGKSAAEIFSTNGVPIIKSRNDRVNGWYAVKEWLKHIKTKDEQTGKETVTSKLKMFTTCTNLIRTLPQLQHDEHNTNDVGDKNHELTHCPDALRYYCSMRQSPTEPNKNIKDDLNIRARFKVNNSNDATQSYISYGVS